MKKRPITIFIDGFKYYPKSLQDNLVIMAERDFNHKKGRQTPSAKSEIIVLSAIVFLHF